MATQRRDQFDALTASLRAAKAEEEAERRAAHIGEANAILPDIMRG